MGGRQEPLYLYGAGGHGRDVLWLARDCGVEVAGVYDDTEALWGTLIGRSGVPILRPDWAIPARCVLVTVSAPHLRRTIVDKHRLRGRPTATLVHPSVQGKPTHIGAGAIICAGTVVAADVSIDNYAIINIGCLIGHDTIVGAFAVIMPGASTGGFSVIDSGAFVGANAAILPHVKVGAGATVGAGAVVTKNVPPGATVVGVPARIVKQAEVEGVAL